MTNPIVLTEFDFERLERIATRLRSRVGKKSVADALELELDRATIVDSRKVPSDVVTMNSQVTVCDLGTHETEVLHIVYPGAATLDKRAVSVLTPLGMALLGVRAGEEVTCSLPGETRRLRVESVSYQPEAAGRFDL